MSIFHKYSGFPTLLIAAAGLLFLGGCATNSMTGRGQLMIVSEESAITRSASSYKDMIGSLEKDGKISENVQMNARIQQITDRLIAQAIRYRPDTQYWNWTIKIIDNPATVNAFCMPGGRMAIYTGLIEKLEPTDDELAQVMGHEIAHALANHGAEKMSVQIASSVAVVAVTAAANRNNPDRKGIHTAAELAALAFINLPNSRTAEEEADRLGIELAARAGYHPRAAVTLWEKMMAESGSKSRSDFFSTHPAPPKRIEALASLEAPMLQLYDADGAKRPPATSWTARSANERFVESADPLAASTPKASDSLYFYSETFEKFKSGNATLACEACAAEFVIRQGTLRDHYAKASWRQLALDTVAIGYGIDLAWYYLGSAAENLGFPEASAKYFAEALTRAGQDKTACAGGFLVSCGGIDVPKAAQR